MQKIGIRNFPYESQLAERNIRTPSETQIVANEIAPSGRAEPTLLFIKRFFGRWNGPAYFAQVPMISQFIEDAAQNQWYTISSPQSTPSGCKPGTVHTVL